MFPLGTVLVPYGVLPLQVFEPRYRVLMFDCLRGNREFGVVLIERGSEVGGADQRFGVATVATIAQAAELPDGRWFLLAVGDRRVDVVEWLAEDPYPVALVEDRPDGAWADTGGSGGTAAALETASRAVRRTLALATEAGEEVAPALVEISDEPVVAGWQLVALAPIASLDKQALLAVDDHAERLLRLAALAEDQSLLLTYRLDRE
jgi:Lon protease-like protein